MNTDNIPIAVTDQIVRQQEKIDKLTAERDGWKRVAEELLVGCSELLSHGTPVPFYPDGEPIPYEANPEIAVEALRHFNEMKEKMK